MPKGAKMCGSMTPPPVLETRRAAEAYNSEGRLEGAVRGAVGRRVRVRRTDEVLELGEESRKLTKLVLQFGPLKGKGSDSSAAEDRPPLRFREIAIGGADGVEEDAELLMPFVSNAHAKGA